MLIHKIIVFIEIGHLIDNKNLLKAEFVSFCLVITLIRTTPNQNYHRETDLYIVSATS